MKKLDTHRFITLFERGALCGQKTVGSIRLSAINFVETSGEFCILWLDGDVRIKVDAAYSDLMSDFEKQESVNVFVLWMRAGSHTTKYTY